MPTGPEITPTPKNSARVSAVDSVLPCVTHQIRPKVTPNCNGNQIRVIRRYQNRSASGVVGSGLSGFSPSAASSTLTMTQP